jgi:hypothetical protein
MGRKGYVYDAVSQYVCVYMLYYRIASREMIVSYLDEDLLIVRDQVKFTVYHWKYIIANSQTPLCSIHSCTMRPMHGCATRSIIYISVCLSYLLVVRILYTLYMLAIELLWLLTPCTPMYLTPTVRLPWDPKAQEAWISVWRAHSGERRKQWLPLRINSVQGGAHAHDYILYSVLGQLVGMFMAAGAWLCTLYSVLYGTVPRWGVCGVVCIDPTTKQMILSWFGTAIDCRSCSRRSLFPFFLLLSSSLLYCCLPVAR